MVNFSILLSVATFFAILGGLALMNSYETIGLFLLRAGMFVAGINIFVSMIYSILDHE